MDNDTVVRLLKQGKAKNLLGRRAQNVESDHRLDASAFLENSCLSRVVEGDEYVFGLTALGSQLFVLRRESSPQVSVYDTDNWTLTRGISIPGSSRLRAIVASPKYNCLYICDKEQLVVYRYNLADNVTTKWNVVGISYGLSLTSTHNVLVTLYSSRQIKEYTPDGNLVRVINLDNRIVYPWHSVQLSADRFVVSHGAFESLHRVCIVDASGRIIQCHGGNRGTGVGQLDGPTNLAVDGVGNVLVVDLYNSRVVLLSPSLTHLGYIATPGDTLKNPWPLHLDQKSRRLYIGENTPAGRVFVLTDQHQYNMGIYLQ